MNASSLIILRSFGQKTPKIKCLMISLPTEKIEHCIRTHFVSFFHIPLSRTGRLLVRHCIFKTLREERKFRYYSMVQTSTSVLGGAAAPDCWDNTPLPKFPERRSSAEMALISLTKIHIDLSMLNRLRFSLPMELDHAILYDSSWGLNSTAASGFRTFDFLTVWDTSSEP